jgi:transposase-like protein
MSPEALDSLRKEIEHLLLLDADSTQTDKEILSVRSSKRKQEPPHCVHCSSDRIRGHGSYKQRRRYLCLGCNRTFTDLTKTCIASFKKRKQLRQYIGCMVQGFSLRKSPQETGICFKTAFDWRHKVLIALKENSRRPLRGEVEVDETFFSYSEKGNRKLSRRPRKPGVGKGPGLIMNWFVSSPQKTVPVNLL